MAEPELVGDIVPDVPSSRDRNADPSEMAADYLVQLAFELYARSVNLQCTEELHNRAQELKAEVLRRAAAGSGGLTLNFDVALTVTESMAAEIVVKGLSTEEGRKALVKTFRREKRDGNV